MPFLTASCSTAWSSRAGACRTCCRCSAPRARLPAPAVNLVGGVLRRRQRTVHLALPYTHSRRHDRGDAPVGDHDWRFRDEHIVGGDGRNLVIRRLGTP